MSFPTVKIAGEQVTATDFNDFSLNPTYTYGETITAGQALYQKASDGKVYKASAGTLAHVESFVGIAIESGVANDTKRILSSGKVTTGLLSGLTDGSVYYLSDTAGAISTTPGRYTLQLGVAKGTTAILLMPIRIVGTLGEFGDFSDGDLAFDGSSDVASVSTRASNVYTLTKNVFADVVTLSNNAIIDNNGYFFLARLIVRVAASTAKFRNNGGAGGNGGNATAPGAGGSAGSAGAAPGSNALPAPQAAVAGGAGAYITTVTTGNGSAGNAGNAQTNSLVATGTLTAGAGGNGVSGTGTGTGGAAGASAANTQTKMLPRSVTLAMTFAVPGGTTITLLRPSCGGPGGGGGGVSQSAGSTQAGGGGGGGSGGPGGAMVVGAEKIIDLGSGTMFEAKGGAGGNGGNGAVNGSGNQGAGGGGPGAGGNGGVVIRFMRWLIGSATVDVSAGAAGSVGTGATFGTGSVSTPGAASSGIAGLSLDIYV